jgi:hypothetical protein
MEISHKIFRIIAGLSIITTLSINSATPSTSSLPSSSSSAPLLSSSSSSSTTHASSSSTVGTTGSSSSLRQPVIAEPLARNPSIVGAMTGSSSTPELDALLLALSLATPETLAHVKAALREKIEKVSVAPNSKELLINAYKTEPFFTFMHTLMQFCHNPNLYLSNHTAATLINKILTITGNTTYLEPLKGFMYSSKRYDELNASQSAAIQEPTPTKDAAIELTKKIIDISSGIMENSKVLQDSSEQSKDIFIKLLYRLTNQEKTELHIEILDPIMKTIMVNHEGEIDMITPRPPNANLWKYRESIFQMNRAKLK